MKDVQEIFNRVADKHELAEDMMNEFRSMDLTEEEYNFILMDWDNLLNKFYNRKVI